MSSIINATTTNGVVIQPDNSGSLVLQTNNGTTAVTVDTSQNTTLAGKLTTASSGIQFSDSSIQTAAASPYVLKNRIINGDMRIDQRNAGASVTANAEAFPVDRFKISTGYSSKATVQQSTTAPTGFNNSILLTSTAATSTSAGDYMTLLQVIEGLNIADLGWGTANAKTVTLSFWVRSSLTGTFGGAITNSGNSRSYVFSYTISAANTWEQKTVTITGDTSGTWLTTNGIGLIVRFSIAMGSTYSNTAGSWYAGDYEGATGQTQILNTNGATWYITGVQLEIGTSATPFERRMYGQEMANCQRYYWKVDGGTTTDYVGLGSGFCQSATSVRIYAKYPVAMRAAPTIAIAGTLYADDGAAHTLSSISTAFEGLDQMMIDFNTSSKNTGRGVVCYVLNSSGCNLTASAEL